MIRKVEHKQVVFRGRRTRAPLVGLGELEMGLRAWNSEHRSRVTGMPLKLPNQWKSNGNMIKGKQLFQFVRRPCDSYLQRVITPNS